MILDVILPLLHSDDSCSFMMLHVTIRLTRVGSDKTRQDALAAGLDQEQPGIIQAPLAGTFEGSCRNFSNHAPNPRGLLAPNWVSLWTRKSRKSF